MNAEPMNTTARLYGDRFAKEGLEVRYVDGVPVISRPKTVLERFRIAKVARELGLKATVYADGVTLAPVTP